MEEGGHVRYLGRSSGFYLLQGSRTYHDGAFHLSGYGHKTASTSSKPDHLDPLALPPSDLSEHLIDLYFKHFYPLLPLFYKRQLIPLGEPKETISPLLLNAIYAVASRFSTDVRVRSDPKSQDTAGDVFFERAKCLLDDYYDVPRISTVQALLLLSSHQQGAMKSARAWLYCGLAFRMALDLGLHRNSEHWNITPEERERRKRVFWCCFIVDRLTTAIYGRALCFEERDCDVPFPTVDDDEPIYKTMDRPPPRILDTFVSCIKLCDILGHVLKNIYYAKAHHHSSSHHIDHVLKTLHQQLTSWLSHLPPSLQYNLANTEVGETVPDPPLAVGQLHMIYYTTMILLHRSFIPGPSQTIESQLSLPSYDLCVLGARAILNIINIMLGENHLRYVLNYSVYFTFTAGIIFIKMASSSEFNTAFDAKVNVNKIMRALDEMENTWMNASRCCNILGELAGLRDINLECNEHDTRYVPRRISKTSNPPLAIDVPNSPEPNEENPIIESSAENENITEQQIFDPNIPTSQSSSKDIPVLKDYNNNNNNFKNLIHPFTSVSPSSTSQMSSASAMDPFAAPDTVMNSQQNQVQQSKFDHFGTYFWGVPSSLNIEDWNQYFSQGVSTPTSTQLKTSFADNTSLIPSHDITSSNVPEFSRPFYSNSLGHNTVSTLPSSIASPISSSSMPSTSKKEADVLFSISLPNTPSQSTLLGYNDTNKS
ncbi:fungal-specific transcription factor domain-containing protein [Cunninghamella echinulata]|nr:fungal-specific transcription factor domain-containing protein [Cunninghamella echinulata]